MSWITQFAFKIVDGFLNLPSKVFQPILWILCGPGQNDQVGGCVQGYDILADMKPNYAVVNQKSFFLHKFSGLKDMSYLDREDVTLYSVTEEEFVFVRTTAGVDICDTETHPFVYNIQHSSAEELLIASHSTVFQYLSSKPDRDGGNIAYLHNPGRCGSTLVAAMMYKTKQCVVLSEPMPILHLALMFNKKDYPTSRKTTEYLDLVRATFLLLCPDPDKLYFIKPWGLQTLSLLPLIHQALPGLREIFMYRSVRPTVLSFKKLIDPNGGGRFEFISNMAVAWLPVNYRNIWEKIKCGQGDEAYCFLVLSQYHAYLLETQDRKDIRSYSYESLLENKEGFTRSMLKEVGIGEESLEAALSALEKDSQANSETHNRERTAGVTVTVSDDVMEWAGKVAREQFEIEIVGEAGQVLDMPHQWTTNSGLVNDAVGYVVNSFAQIF